MAPGHFVTGDGTSYVAEIRRRGGFKAFAKWALFTCIIIGTFLLGVRLGTGGIYVDAVESLESLVVDSPSDMLAPAFAKLRQVDATEEPGGELSRFAIAKKLGGIEGQCLATGRKADEAWSTYFVALRTIINSEIQNLKKASESQSKLLNGLGPNAEAAQQQCSRARELLELILFQLAAPREEIPTATTP